GQADAQDGEGLVDVVGSTRSVGLRNADAGEGQHAGGELIGQAELVVVEIADGHVVVLTPGTFDTDTDRTRSGTVGQVADTSGVGFTLADIGDVLVVVTATDLDGSAATDVDRELRTDLPARLTVVADNLHAVVARVQSGVDIAERLEVVGSNVQAFLRQDRRTEATTAGVGQIVGGEVLAVVRGVAEAQLQTLPSLRTEVAVRGGVDDDALGGVLRIHSAQSGG